MSDVSQIFIPRGFRFGAARAGLKASGRTDFALIVANEPASAAAAFTSNRVIAAPLIVDKENLHATGGRVRVAAINAGNANCAAGLAGLDAARATCAAAAEVFACKPEEVFPSSTGIIGVPLPVEKLIAALPGLAAALGSESDHFQQVAQAILTTDTVVKTASQRLEIDGKEVRIAATGKGSGMIHPQLVPHATMLVFVLTDAAVEPAALLGYLRQAIEVTFNRISVDGDTSTNDTVLLLASGASGERRGRRRGQRRVRRRAQPGLRLAGAADCGRRRGSLARCRTPYRRRGDQRRRPADRQSHCPLSPGEDGVGRLRSKLGTARRGHRLLRRGHRPGPHRHPVWPTAHLPQWRPRPGI
jgi:glutamate N-acetyltransferase/amino-acid N-acetyltransferase